MIRITELVLPLEIPKEERLSYLKQQAAKRLKVSVKQIQSCALFKQSVDARKKDQIVFRCTVDITIEKEQAALAKAKDKRATVVAPYHYEIPLCHPLEQRPVVVGFGPAGMFAALLLAQAGQRPIVLERGGSVEDRQQTVERFWQTGVLDTQCNVQFGEGGAGTFSDGKLNTGTKDSRARKVLEELQKAGAPEEILYQSHPHVGTDRLPQTVRNIREQIRALGGEVLFRTQLVGIGTKNGAVVSVTAKNAEGEHVFDTNHVVLAIGHSARDTYALLHGMGVFMEQKPFSVGARIEHPQSIINKAQYGKFAEHPALGAAEYKQALHLPNGRGVYIFCMCPGGQVVASSSEENMVVTNGMSNFARDGENANAALLVGIGPEDFGSTAPLAGMELQRKLERAAFQLGGGTYRAPGQRVEDFLKKRASTGFGEVTPTYQRGVTPCDLHEILPDFVAESMEEGIRRMDARLHGFAFPNAVLTGVETRSSAPVRLLRNEKLQSVSLQGLYPCGEGAGYAGGIVSAAVDGLRCGEMILQSVKK